MASDLRGSCSRVENDRFARLNQFCRGPADADFLLVMKRLFRAQRIILGGFKTPHCAAMRAHQRSDRRKSVQIAANGHSGNRKPLHQVRDRNLALLVH